MNHLAFHGFLPYLLNIYNDKIPICIGQTFGPIKMAPRAEKRLISEAHQHQKKKNLEPLGDRFQS